MGKKLVVISGMDTGREFPLPDAGAFVLGRSKETDSRLADPRVSRKHCQLVVSAAGIVLQEVPGTSGTFVNNEKVAERPILPGDVIRIGTTELRLQEDDPYEAATLGGAQLQAIVNAAPPPAPVSAPAPTVAPSAPLPAPAPPPAVVAEDASVAGEPLTSLLGAPLGYYRIEAILARGHSSFIFRATDTRDGRKVALKVMRAKHAAVERDVLLFQATLQLFHGLQHPNLITVFDTGKEKAHLWAAQELVEGESLSAAIERVSAGATRDWRSALRIARDVARGLDFLHKAEVLHRNVTPRCIRLSGKDETAKLGGFRQAARLGTAPFPPRRNEDILREVEFLPPERLRSECKGDERSDIYSLGACLYALLTGRPPFENRGSLPETLNQILQNNPVQSEAFADLPEDVQQLVGRMLAKRSEDRPAMRELLGELERLLAAPAEQPAAPPMPAPPPVPAPAIEMPAPEPATPKSLPTMAFPAAPPIELPQPPLPPEKPMATIRADEVLPLPVPVSKPIVPPAPPESKPLGDGTLMQMPPAIVQAPLLLQPADEPTYLGEGPPDATANLEEIGRGEHATVFRDHSKPTKPVAIKQLNEEVRNGLFQTKGFWDEVQFLTDLDHANVVKIQKLDAERGWIVMDLLPTSLAKKLAEGPLSAEFVRKVIEQSLMGLKYLHQQNKLHGTIKPSNILLTSDGNVKLGDCAGLRLEAALQKPRTKMKYVAPEMLDTRFGRIGAGVDLYCLGFVALEMLMGKRIDTQFARVRDAGKNADLGWARQHASRSEKLPSVAELAPDTPADLVRVLDRMLHKEVSQRYRSAGEALRELRGGGSSIQADPVVPPARKPAPSAEGERPPSAPAPPKAPPRAPAPPPAFDPNGSALAPVATAPPKAPPRAGTSWQETTKPAEAAKAKSAGWLASPLLLLPVLALLSFGAFAAVMWGGLGGLFGGGGGPPTTPVVGGARPPSAALLIGVNDAGKELPYFRHAEADMQELGRLLVAADYKPASVVVLTQNQGDAKLQPTAANIRQQLKTLTEQRKPVDGLLLALAGHVVQFRDEDEAYFCPADSRLADKSTLVPLSEIYQTLEKWNGDASLVLLDVTRASNAGDDDPPASPLLNPTPNPQKIAPPKNVPVFFSCGGGKKSYCHLEQRNGAFFHYITRRLQGVGDIDLSKRTSIDDLVKFVTAEVYAYVTKTYGEVQRPEMVGPTARPAILAEVTPPVSLYMQGLSNFRQRRYGEATFYCGRSIGEREYVEAYLLQGASKAEQGKLNEALADFTRALELSPGNADAHAGRAEVYLRRGDGAAALKEAQKAIDLDRGFGPFYAIRAQARLLLKENEAAFADFDKAIALSARSPRMLNARGRGQLKAGNLDAAWDDFSAAAKAAPADPEALLNRGLVAEARKQPVVAASEFSKALEVNPDFAPAYFHRARAYDQLATDERDADAKRQHQLRAAADREKARSLGFVAALVNE